MALSINDSLYSCLFFFLTGLHFFHLTIGLLLLSLIFWSCSFSYYLEDNSKREDKKNEDPADGTADSEMKEMCRVNLSFSYCWGEPRGSGPPNNMVDK